MQRQILGETTFMLETLSWECRRNFRSCHNNQSSLDSLLNVDNHLGIFIQQERSTNWKTRRRFYKLEGLTSRTIEFEKWRALQCKDSYCACSQTRYFSNSETTIRALKWQRLPPFWKWSNTCCQILRFLKRLIFDNIQVVKRVIVFLIRFHRHWNCCETMSSLW